MTYEGKIIRVKVAKKCYWWNKWWHKRLREYDKRVIIPIMLYQITELGIRLKIEIFYNFVHTKGQEHWLCSCGKPEYLFFIKSIK